LERGDYVVKGGSPHVPAALLKAWLRDLTTPLIPFDMYDAAISIGNSGGGGAPARPIISKGGDDDDEDDGPSAPAAPVDVSAAVIVPKVTALIKSLPALNRRIIQHLVVFMRKVL
jgi:hypothetical protein